MGRRGVYPACMKRLVYFCLPLLVVALVGGLLALDSFAKAAVEQGGTSALGVETTLGSASIGLFSGSVELEDLRIANPAGWQSESFLELDQGDCDIALKSLFDDPVRAQLLSLRGVRVALEQNDSSSNYGQLLENVAKNDTKDADTSEKKSGKGYLIDRIELRDVEVFVHLGNGLLGTGLFQTEATLKIPKIMLENQDSRSLDMDGLVSFLTTRLLEEIVKDGAGLPKELLDGLDTTVNEILELDEVLDAGVEGLKKLGEGVENVGESAGKALKGVLGEDD